MKYLNANAYREIIENEEETCLILFSRKSCPVCQQVKPKIEELEADYADFSFYGVDSEENESLIAKCGVKGVPQVLFFKDGEEYKRLAGNNDTDDYADVIEELL